MSDESGFSVIEFVVLVVIVTAVVVLGLPRYKEFRARAVQHEARINLNQIDHLQQKYFFSNDAFAADLDELGFNLKHRDKYQYSIISADQDGYIAQAEAGAGTLAECAGRDVWTINQNKTLRNLENGVRFCAKGQSKQKKRK